MSKYSTFILFIIFAVVLSIRLYFAFSTAYFTSDDSYFHLRQIEHIREAGKPIFDDSLSYSGRAFIFSPVFHYIIAFFSLFMPVAFAAKLLPNIFAASLVFSIYLISKKITKSTNVALFTAFLSGFVPVFFAETASVLTPLSLAVPLIFLLIYAFMSINKQAWLYCYLAGLVLLSFLHPIVSLFILGLFIYLILVLVESLKQSREELEISIFSIFFVLWAQFLIYKKPLLYHGLLVVWQNIPKEILSTHFAATTIFGAIYQIGIIPFVIGLYVVYLFLFKRKQKDIYLIMAFAASAGLLLWLRFIELKIGLIFFGLVLVVLFSQWCLQFVETIKKTKASRYLSYFAAVTFIAFLVFSVYPSFALAQKSSQAVAPEEIAALEWIRSNTPVQSVVVATVNEGNLITAVAQRKNIIDSDFLMQRESEERFNDIKRIYTTI
jgi:asparagine N-glycosylation enzyme membrane subunit Stt3